MRWIPKHRVVVPVDFSENCVEAVRIALEHVERPEDVHVIHVMPTMELASPEALWVAPDEEAGLSELKAHLDEFLKNHGLTGVTAVVERGDPGLGIVDYARDHEAELIVIPSHGYHGIKRLFLGSVAERVLRHGRCPTLVLRRAEGA